MRKSRPQRTLKPKSPTANASPKTTTRLNKVIADSGLCSRRTADTWIAEGKVSVNLEKVTTPGVQVTDNDIVLVNDKPLPRTKPVYALFHKPVGVVTTRSDEKGRQTIYDVLSKRYQRCDTAGRLDRQSSGAIILSTDGDFIHTLTHPKFGCKKVYRVQVDKALTPEVLKSLRTGVKIPLSDEPGSKMVLAVAERVDSDIPTKATITLATGYNRQIRRMLGALGYTVTKLRRLSIGPISLGRLAEGKARPLTDDELKKLKRLRKYADKDREAAEKAEKDGTKPDNRKNKHGKAARAPKGKTGDTDAPKPMTHKSDNPPGTKKNKKPRWVDGKPAANKKGKPTRKSPLTKQPR